MIQNMMDPVWDGLCDDESEPEGDDLESKLIVLRDVMAGYQTSFLLDVRDPEYESRLSEALRLLDVTLRLSVKATESDGPGHGFGARLELSGCGSAVVYEGTSWSCDPAVSALIAVRSAYQAAGLVQAPTPVSPTGGTRALPVR